MSLQFGSRTHLGSVQSALISITYYLCVTPAAMSHGRWNVVLVHWGYSYSPSDYKHTVT
jgi:hypothetical protein